MKTESMHSDATYKCGYTSLGANTLSLTITVIIYNQYIPDNLLIPVVIDRNGVGFSELEKPKEFTRSESNNLSQSLSNFSL